MYAILTDNAVLRPVHTPLDVVRQPLCDNRRRRPLLSVVDRRRTANHMHRYVNDMQI